MILLFKCIKQILLFGFMGCLLLSFNATAAECGVLQLQNNRSSGVSVSSNKCNKQSNISIGTVFDLSARGRLWLKSLETGYADHEFQMICQNRTAKTVQLAFTESFLPWLSIANLNNCSGWIDHKLSCDGNSGEKDGIHCVLAFIKPGERSKTEHIERTSSVKMRDVSQLFEADNSGYDAFDKQQFVETLVSELKLCKKLVGFSQDVSINWVVQMAEVKMLNVLTPWAQNNETFSACIGAVISTTAYPRFSKEVSFKSVF